MKIGIICVLIINIVICVSEDPKASTVTVSDEKNNPTNSLEKGVEGFVKIVHSFLKNVQSEDFIDKNTGSITYNDVREIIKEGDYGKFGDRWRDLAAVFGGFAACVVIGLLFILCMPVAGCLTCCCYCCCKRCGKASSKEDPKNAKCKRVTFATILFIFSILMLVGAIFAVISNEILHSKLENANDEGPIGQIKSAVSGLKQFADDTATKFVDETTNTANKIVNDILGTIKNSTNQIVKDIQDTINATELLKQVEDLGKNANSSVDSLTVVTNEVGTLKSLGTDVTQRIADIKSNVTDACAGGPWTSSCPSLTDLSLGPSFSGLDDLSGINNLVMAVTNISKQAGTAREEFDKIQTKISDKVNGVINDSQANVENIKDNILKELPKMMETVTNLTKSLNITKELNSADAEMKKYGDYVWYAFIGASCLILLVVLFYLFGLFFGAFGARPGPHASCCNKGAGSNMLCCGVTCSYLVGSLLMLVVIVMFVPFGLIYTNGCQYLNDGVENIGKFESIVKDTLGYSIRDYIDKDPKLSNISIGNILGNCKENQGVYDAFFLKNIFSLDPNDLNISQINSNIDGIVAQGNSLKLDNISIITPELQNDLNKFASSGVDSINFTQYDSILNVPLVTVDFATLIAQLHNASQTLNNSGETEKATTLQKQAEALLVIQLKIADIELARGSLSEGLTHLKGQTNLTVKVRDLIDSLTKSQNDFNTQSQSILDTSLKSTATSLKTTVNNSITDIKTKIATVGQCKIVYDNVQLLSDAFCVTILDRVNSIWFGLGWGLAFFIPCIIFALLTANLYQREEPYDRSFHQTRKILKKRSKEESGFDNPDIDMYQGQGYDAYSGQGADNIPLTGMRHDQPGNRSSGGLSNQGYRSPEHRGNGYHDQRNSGYPIADYHHGYPEEHPSAPPPYNGHSYDDNMSRRANMYRKPDY